MKKHNKFVALGIIAMLFVTACGSGSSFSRYLEDNKLVSDSSKETKEDDNYSDTFSGKEQRNDFDSAEKNLKQVGIYTVELPSYFSDDVNDAVELRSYTDDPGDDAISFITIKSSYDDKDPATYEMVIDETEHNKYLDSLKNEITDFNLISDEKADFGETKGYLEELTGTFNGYDCKLYIYHFASEENNSWFSVWMTENAECRYDYLDDFKKILATLKKTKTNTTISAPGVYIGVDGSVMILKEDGSAGYYYKDYKEIDTNAVWTSENRVTTIELKSMFSKVVADLSSGSTDSIMFNSKSMFWNDEEYYKLSDDVPELTVEDCENLINTASPDKAMLALSEIKEGKVSEEVIIAEADEAEEIQSTEPLVEDAPGDIKESAQEQDEEPVEEENINWKEELPFKFDENYSKVQNLYIYIVNNKGSIENVKTCVDLMGLSYNATPYKYAESDELNYNDLEVRISDSGESIAYELVRYGADTHQSYLRYSPPKNYGLVVKPCKDYDAFYIQDMDTPQNVDLRGATGFKTLREAIDFINRYNGIAD